MKMRAISAFLGVQLLVSVSLMLGSCLAFDQWEDFATWAAEVHGTSDLGLRTSLRDDIFVNGSEIYKTTATNLEAIAADEVRLKSTSKLITYEGDHTSAIQSTIDQKFDLPEELAFKIFQSHEISGFPDDPLANLSSTVDIIDPLTGDILISFSSNKNDEDIDMIINQALKEMGFTLTIDDFRALKGSTQYSVDRYDAVRKITCNWGETKNLPLDLG